MLIYWLNLNNIIKVGKIVSFNKEIAKVQNYKEKNEEFQIKKSYSEIFHSNLIIFGNLLTKKMKMKKE
jgi:hypothetical protein